jgi:hypothetical protein
MLVTTSLLATAPWFGGGAAQTGEYCQFGGTAFHCFSTYEFSSDALALRLGCNLGPGQVATFDGCPLGTDGHLDVGGVLYDGGRSPNHARNGGNPDRDLPLGVFDETVYINDLVFGQNVGGFYCTDANGNRLCGEPGVEGEFAVLFCGHTKIPGQIDTSKFFYSAYYVVGPLFQGRDCPQGGNPIGGTTGSLSIWLTPPPPEQPPEQPPGGEAEYGVWGGASGG